MIEALSRALGVFFSFKAYVMLPLIIALNLGMLATNTTRTVFIDVWNCWHFALFQGHWLALLVLAPALALCYLAYRKHRRWREEKQGPAYRR